MRQYVNRPLELDSSIYRSAQCEQVKPEAKM